VRMLKSVKYKSEKKGIEWPLEKLKFEHWKIAKHKWKRKYAEWFLEQYVKRNKKKQFDWMKILEAESLCWRLSSAIRYQKKKIEERIAD
jgi:hypothetical protein